jgi:hypothetical protein
MKIFSEGQLAECLIGFFTPAMQPSSRSAEVESATIPPFLFGFRQERQKAAW